MKLRKPDGSIRHAQLLSLRVEKSRYINVDELQAQTPLEEATAKCGVILDVKGHGKEVRIDCPFGCSGDHCGRKEVSINVDNPQKVFRCHAYTCGFRGNLLTLMHGWRMRARDFNSLRFLWGSQVRMSATWPSSPSCDNFKDLE